MRIDVIGRLTAEETKDVMRECIKYLGESDLFEVLESELTAEQKAELSETWTGE